MGLTDLEIEEYVICTRTENVDPNDYDDSEHINNFNSSLENARNILKSQGIDWTDEKWDYINRWKVPFAVTIEHEPLLVPFDFYDKLAKLNLNFGDNHDS